MAFSLSNWFKGKSTATTDIPVKGTAVAPPATPVLKSVAPSRPAPPSGPGASPVTRTVPTVRKVVPNSVQPVSLRDPSARPPVSLVPGGPGAARPVTSLVPARKISLGNPAATVAAHASLAPEPVAPAPEPEPAFVPASMPDVPVNLEVGDFIDRLPPTLLAGGAVDRSRTVEFRSSELYSDLTKGRASVPASVIYEKCPDLFSRPVSETEDAEVPLPLAKLVEQLTPALQTRADQVAEDNVGEIETPFLQVAMEDNARLPTAAGTTAGAIRPLVPLPAAPLVAPVQFPNRPPHRTGQIQAITAPKTPLNDPASLPAAPTAQSIGPINPGKRPPSTVRASVAGGKIRLSGPTVPSRISLTPGQPVSPPPTVPFNAPPAIRDDLPPSATQRIATSMPPLPASVASPSHQVTKKTQRIQIPPISLRSPANPAATPPPRPPTIPPPAVPVQPSPVTVRQNNGDSEGAGPVAFHSAPSPRPMPHTFAPSPTKPAFPPPAFPAMPPASAAPAPTPAPVADDRQITLGLAAILRGMSASLLAVEPSSVPDDVTVSLPFALVESQMRTGRVSVPRATFIEALPEGHKDVLDADVDLPEIPLPLQEVFQNLPSNALTMRADQTEDQITHLYPTPFSQKAEEDAQRLGVGEVPTNVPPPVSEAATAPTVEPEAASPTDHPLPAEEPPSAEVPAPAVEEAPTEHVRDIPLDLEEKAPVLVEDKVEIPAPAVEETSVSEIEAPEPAPSAQKIPTPAKGKDSELQVLFMTEEELDAKTIVRFVSQMPGINGCAVMFGDGLRLAGNFPGESQVEGFSAMAPPFFKRARNFASESGLGNIQAFTLHTDQGPCSFLMHDDICVGVRHSNRGFMPGVREKLEIVVRELARMYSTAS